MKLTHITINTSDLQSSIGFYQSVLKMEIANDMRPDMPIVFLRNAPKDVEIELMENAIESLRATGISLGFNTDNVEERRNELIAAGYEPTEMVSPHPGVRFFFLKDPNGLNIQFM